MSNVYAMMMSGVPIASMAAEIKAMKEEIASLSGGDMRVLSFSKDSLTVAFYCDIPSKQIAERVNRFYSNEQTTVVFRVESLVAGTLSSDSLSWLHSRLRRT